MSIDRSWMYRRCDLNGRVRDEYFDGVSDFIWRAQINASSALDSNLISCPCLRCRNVYALSSDKVYEHLVKNGFVQDYFQWNQHRETNSMEIDNGAESSGEALGNEYNTMVGDGMGVAQNIRVCVDENLSEAPNRSVAEYYELLHAANDPVYDGCISMTKLSLVSQLINLKAESLISQRNHERYVDIMRRLTPDQGRNIPSTYYAAKKLLLPLRLPHRKIDACIDNCMLFYKEDANLSCCKHCGKSRYKADSGYSNKANSGNVLTYFPIGPRLQRLYMSEKTTNLMTWHDSNKAEDGFMTHPSHGGAWKHFDGLYPDFANEPRNVRIGLCTDGFNPFGQFGRNYSCWPVMICVYNLPPGLCMKDPYIFLSLIVPGPKNPGRDLDVFLRPLIDELSILWKDGIMTYDASRKQNFNMRVTLMWTISDFPAYGMLSGWSTHGKLACPYCMEETDSHYLPKGRKVSWFDCHRKFLPRNHPDRKNQVAFRKGKVVIGNVVRERLSGRELLNCIRRARPLKVFGLSNRKVKSNAYGIEHNWTKKSIFWKLPYWKHNLIRHNLDLMHIEKNDLENLLFTSMDVKAKTKDNAKAREDLKSICCRTELHLINDARLIKIKPKASYVLSKDQQTQVRSWLQNLKLPDGCASNISRCTMTEGFTGLKSHDCHVLIEKLLPVAFRQLLPDAIWEAVVDLCHFFRDLCSATLRVDHLHVLDMNIPQIICKLEKIFPPAFFDVMEHLPIHLPYEAINGGPCQYRWMYPFESYLGKLKQMVRQKAFVEGSITEAYLLKEVSSFCAMYFEEEVHTNHRQAPRNDDGGEIASDVRLSIFRHPGRPTKCIRNLQFMTEEESKIIHLYVLKNTPEVTPLYEMFSAELIRLNPNSTHEDRIAYEKEKFSTWLQSYVALNIATVDHRLVTLTNGPYCQIKKYKGYFTNGFRFDTNQGRGRKTNNSGVIVKGTYSSDDNGQLDYYGEITEIWKLLYSGVMESVILFNCIWFANDEKNMRVHPTNGLIEIRRNSRMSKDDQFILASQAQQVYYLDYVSKNTRHKQWQVVCKTRARNRIDMTHIMTSSTSSLQDDSRESMYYQEAEMSQPVPLQPNNDLNDPTNLVDLDNYDMIDMAELAEENPPNEEDSSTNDEDEEDEYLSISTEEDGDNFEDEEDEFF